MDDEEGRRSSEQSIPVASVSTIEVLGCRVSKVTLGEALDLIERWIQQPAERSHCVVATGFHGLWEAHRDPEFQKVLNSADLFCSDGIAPVLLSRLNGDALPERVPGADLLAAFLSKADKSGYSKFFGDTDETLAALKESAQKGYPGHRVAGGLSPPFRKMSAAKMPRSSKRSTARDRTYSGLVWVRRNRIGGYIITRINCGYRWWRESGRRFGS